MLNVNAQSVKNPRIMGIERINARKLCRGIFPQGHARMGAEVTVQYARRKVMCGQRNLPCQGNFSPVAQMGAPEWCKRSGCGMAGAARAITVC